MSLLKCLVLHRGTMAIAASVVVHSDTPKLYISLVILFCQCLSYYSLRRVILLKPCSFTSITPLLFTNCFSGCSSLSLLLSKVLSAVRRNNFQHFFCICILYGILLYLRANLELAFFLYTCDFSLRVHCSTAGCSPSSTLEHSQWIVFHRVIVFPLGVSSITS